jgi:hypothetical protein
MTRTKKAFRFSEAVAELIHRLTKHLGMSQTGVVERAVRELAQRQKVGKQKTPAQ